jgi:hypothetical protein
MQGGTALDELEKKVDELCKQHPCPNVLSLKDSVEVVLPTLNRDAGWLHYCVAQTRPSLAFISEAYGADSASEEGTSEAFALHLAQELPAISTLPVSGRPRQALLNWESVLSVVRS